MQVAADGMPAVAVAEHLTQLLGLSSPASAPRTWPTATARPSTADRRLDLVAALEVSKGT
jgi:hypothetical protein